ncbi:MAG: serine protease [Gemmataceae bacterium]
MSYVLTMSIMESSRQADGRHMALRELGTACYLGDGFFVTAGHCLEEVPKPESFRVLIPTGSSEAGPAPATSYSIVQFERNTDFDFGIFRVEIDIAAKHSNLWRSKWSLHERAPVLTDVLLVGHPHALSAREFGVYGVRGYKGHIVTMLPHRLSPDGPPVFCYELSCAVPKGMSGASVHLQNRKGPNFGSIIGFAIGTKETAFQMRIEKEVEDDGTSKNTLIRSQIVNYGIAVPCAAVADIRFEMLGVTIREYLQRHNLIETKRRPRLRAPNKPS